MNTEERIKDLEHELSVASKWADDRADHVNDLIAENVKLRDALQSMVDTYEHEASMENEALLKAKYILSNVPHHLPRKAGTPDDNNQ
jgi:hypothetical protein